MEGLGSTEDGSEFGNATGTYPVPKDGPSPPPGVSGPPRHQKLQQESQQVPVDTEMKARRPPPSPPLHKKPPGDVPVSAPGLNEPASAAIMIDEEMVRRANKSKGMKEGVGEKEKNGKNESSAMEHIQESKTREELRYRPVIVGICGGTGSGKTTLTKAIVERLGEEHVSLISHDSYYRDLQHLTVEERAEVNFDHPAALDSSLLSTHIDMLKEGIPVQCPVYDFTTHSRKKDEYVRIDPSKIVLVDGILIFAEPKILESMDMKIFVDTADDIRFMRRLQRDVAERARTVDSTVSQYQKTVRPMHKLFVEPSRRSADIIVPSCDGIQEVALDMVVSRLRELIAQHEADLVELRRRVR